MFKEIKGIKGISVLSLLLALVLVFSVGANAADGPALVDSTELEDITQGKIHEFEADQDISTSTWTNTNTANIYFTKASFVKVSVPKTIIFKVEDSTASGKIEVKVQGDISTKQKFVVTFPESITFTSGAKTISEDLEGLTRAYAYNELSSTVMTSLAQNISISNVTAGSYVAPIVIDLKLTNDL